MATKKRKNSVNLRVLLIEGWASTMRVVINKHVIESSPDKSKSWSLNDYFNNKNLSVQEALTGQHKEFRKKLQKNPIDIDEWDVTLICLILRKVCVLDATLQNQYQRLESDVKTIQKIRNELSHSGSLEMEDTVYKTKFGQIQNIINEGLKYANDSKFTEEMNKFVKDVETGMHELDEEISRFENWYENDANMRAVLDLLPKGKYDIKPTMSRLKRSLGMTTEPEKETNEEEKYLSGDEYFLERSKRVKQRPKRDIEQHKPKLIELVGQLETIVDIISQKDAFKTALGVQYPNLTSDLSHHIKYMKDDRILGVAGDPGSGKKSFINLLFGASILPVGQTPSPVGIIKIKKGTLAVKPPNGSLKTPEKELNKDEAAEFVRKVLSLSSSVHSDVVAETVVYWPFESELFQDDVIVVVETGLRDETNAIEQYFPKCTAFLYIVDGGRADGVKTDRLRNIWKLQHLKAEQVIVLLNKWDVVSSDVDKDDSVDARRKAEKEQEKWSNSQDVIKTALEDIKLEHIMKTSVWQEIGRISPCIGIDSDQTERARSIIYSLFDEEAIMLQKWMKTFGQFISDVIENEYCSVTQNVSQHEKDFRTYCWKHEQVSEMSRTLKSDVEKYMTERSNMLSTSIKFYIRTKDVATEMHDWKYDDFPCSLVWDSRETVKSETTKAVLERLSKIIVTNKDGEFETFVTDLRRYIKSKTDDIVQLLDELKKMQSNLGNIDSESVNKIYELALSEYYKLSDRLDDILNEGLLGLIFNHRILYAILFVSLPFAFLFNLLYNRQCISPQTMIMQKTADDVISALDSKTLSKAIMGQLKTCKDAVEKFATNVLLKSIRILLPEPELLLKGIERFDSIRDEINALNGRVGPFLKGCQSL